MAGGLAHLPILRWASIRIIGLAISPMLAVLSIYFKKMTLTEKLDLVKDHLTKSYEIILEVLADTEEIEKYKDDYINQLHESAKELRKVKRELFQ